MTLKSGHELPDEAVDVYWDAMKWPSVVTGVLKECDDRIHKWKFRFQDELRSDQKTLVEDIDSISAVVDQFVEQGDINAVEERLAYVQEVESKLKSLVEKSELYQSREELFGMALTEYPQLESIMKAFEPYGNMWKMCAEFSRSLPEWMDGPFTALAGGPIVYSHTTTRFRSTQGLAEGKYVLFIGGER